MCLGWLWAGCWLSICYLWNGHIVYRIDKYHVDQLWPNYGLAIDWLLAGYWLSIGCLLTGYHMTIRCLLAVYQLAFSWQSDGYWLAIGWLSYIYWLTKGLPWFGYGLAIVWLSAIHWLAISWLPSGCWLAIDWLCPKINTIQDIGTQYYVSKWHMTATNTSDCSVFTRFFGYKLAISWLLDGYWLAIGWLLACYWLAIGWLCPKINTLQDIVIYDYVPNVPMAAINALCSSVFTRLFGYQLGIGWLLAGYIPKSIHLKNGNILYIPKWHMVAINTLDCIIFTRIFGYCLPIGWLLDGYVPKSIHFKT